MKDTDASAQFVFGVRALLGKALWGVGKTLLKRNLVQNIEHMRKLHYYYEDDKEEKAIENDAKALNQLKALFGALKEVEAKILQENIDVAGSKDAKAEAWWKKAKWWIKNAIEGVIRKFLC